MMEILQQVFQYVNKLSQGNQIIGGAISLWGLGILTYLCRNVPLHVYSLLKKHLTTEVVVTSRHDAFHNLSSWLMDKNFANKVRRIKLSNGKWGCDNDAIKTVGYGSHIIWFKRWCPVLITITRSENSLSESDKETISMIKMGRSHQMFNDLIKDISHKKEDNNKVSVYEYDKGWCLTTKIPKRPLNSIFIEKDKLDLIINRIQKFIDSEKWYVDNGVPYQMGILLYGPPGTGKTSIIKTIAGHFNKKLATTRISKILGCNLFRDLPNNSIVVFEDVDSADITNKRKANDNNEVDTPNDDSELAGFGEELEKVKKENANNELYTSMMEQIKAEGLSGLLNALDGLISVHGRIVFMTTNYPEVLDKALIRPGRIDLKIKIGHVNQEIFKQFLDRFYHPHNVNFDQLKIKHGISCAQLQECVLNGDNLETLLNKYTISE